LTSGASSGAPASISSSPELNRANQARSSNSTVPKVHRVGGVHDDDAAELSGVRAHDVRRLRVRDGQTGDGAPYAIGRRGISLFGHFVGKLLRSGDYVPTWPPRTGA
jgi:hypothetical protein